MKDPKFKLDKETELFRAFKSDRSNFSKKELDNMKNTGYKINYKGMEINLEGFTIVSNKKTKELVFAYKFKHESCDLIYYSPENKDNAYLIDMFQKMCIVMKYNLVDMSETLESIYQEYGRKE